MKSYILVYKAVFSVESQLKFRRNMLLPSSGSKNKPNKKPVEKIPLLASYWFLAWPILRSRTTKGHVSPKRLLTFNKIY
jgi:hypothetical protein